MNLIFCHVICWMMKSATTSFSKVWEREGAKQRRNPGVGKEQKDSWCWAGGSHCGAPTSTIPGKTKNLELLCVFVVDVCSTRDFSIYIPGEIFLLGQQEPPQTLWKQEMYCNAQKLVTFNQWEIQHSNTLNMEEQQKCSKKKKVWNVRILHLKLSTHKENRTSVLFVFLFYKENTQKPL